jgi:hypothetical protein
MAYDCPLLKSAIKAVLKKARCRLAVSYKYFADDIMEESNAHAQVVRSAAER